MLLLERAAMQQPVAVEGFESADETLRVLHQFEMSILYDGSSLVSLGSEDGSERQVFGADLPTLAVARRHDLQDRRNGMWRLGYRVLE